MRLFDAPRARVRSIQPPHRARSARGLNAGGAGMLQLPSLVSVSQRRSTRSPEALAVCPLTTL